MDIINNILEQVIVNFDFSFCIAVNILTYILISLLDSITKKYSTIWRKRIILCISIIIIGSVYYLIGDNVKVLVNSAILAPVSWSWIFKPIMGKIGLDYRQFDN